MTSVENTTAKETSSKRNLSLFCDPEKCDKGSDATLTSPTDEPTELRDNKSEDESSEDNSEVHKISVPLGSPPCSNASLLQAQLTPPNNSHIFQNPLITPYQYGSKSFLTIEEERPPFLFLPNSSEVSPSNFPYPSSENNFHLVGHSANMMYNSMVPALYKTGT